MERQARLDVNAGPAAVFAVLSDLARYPAWTDLVQRAVPSGTDDGGRAAWAVDLRGQVGPLARSKRLRMVRTRCEPDHGVTFERREDDGRSHAAWTLEADVEALGEGARVTVAFRYEGGLWGPVVERLLGDEIERSKPRLAALVTSSGS